MLRSRTIMLLAILALVIGSLGLVGCSSDDDSTEEETTEESASEETGGEETDDDKADAKAD